MSIWGDMGLFNSRMNGVNPCTFLNAAYGFSHDLRKKLWPERTAIHTPDFDYTAHRKGTDGSRLTTFWPHYNWYFSFPDDEYGPLGRPVPEEYWNSIPRWSEILTYDEQRLIGEEIIQNPYFLGPEKPDITDPAWPLQRYNVIQHLRYLSVPLDIRTKEYNEQLKINEWKDYKYEYHYYQDNSIRRDDFYWHGRNATVWGYVQVEARISEYWRQGNTVCKIGYEGRWKDDWDQQHFPPAPLNGCAWSDGNYFLSDEFTENLGNRSGGDSIVWLYGVVDLATHPDFAQYFDINEEEEQ